MDENVAVMVRKRDVQTNKIIEEIISFPDLHHAVEWMERENDRDNRRFEIASIRPQC